MAITQRPRDSEGKGFFPGQCIKRAKRTLLISVCSDLCCQIYFRVNMTPKTLKANGNVTNNTQDDI